MSELFTNLVYKSDKINFKFENNFKQVICQHPIKKGEILMIEHKLYGTKETLEEWLTIDELSRNELYPRTNDATIHEKIMMNSFKDENDQKLSIGIYSSWFNTSPNFNATSLSDCLSKLRIRYLYDDILFSIVVALKDIVPDEEIFIYYERSREGLTPSGEEHKELLKEYYAAQDKVWDECNKEYYKQVAEYLECNICLEIHINVLKLKCGKELEKEKLLISKIYGVDDPKNIDDLSAQIKRLKGFNSISKMYRKLF